MTTGAARRRAALALGAGALAATVLAAAPAGAEAQARDRCANRGSATVASNAQVRVYTLRRRGGTNLVSCSRTTGRHSRLDRAAVVDPSHSATVVFGLVRLKRRYVGWHRAVRSQQLAADGTSELVVGRHEVRVARTTDGVVRRVETNGAPRGGVLRLNRFGQAIWVDRDPATATDLLLALTTSSATTLDRGTIAPSSLRLSGRIARWTRDDQTRTALLR